MKQNLKTSLSALILFICLLLANNISVIPGILPKVVLAWLAFIFIPGDCLYYICFKGKKDFSLLEKIPVIFCLGLGFFCILGLAAYLIQFTWLVFGNLVLALSLALLVVRIIVEQGNRLNPEINSLDNTNDTDELTTFGAHKTERRLLIVFVTTIFVITIISFFLGGSLSLKPDSKYLAEVSQLPTEIVGHRTSDKFVHWGYIKKLMDSKTISNQWPALNYSYNIWHLLIVLLTKISGASYIWIWSYSILICVPLSVLAVFSLGNGLFNNTRIGLACAFIYLTNSTLFNTYFSDVGLWGWIGSPNPREIGFILMTIIILFYLKYILYEEKVFLWLTVFLGAATLFIHDIDSFFIIISLILYAFLFILFRMQDKNGLKRTVKVLAILSVIVIPLLFMKSPTKVKLSDSIAANPELNVSLSNDNGEIMGVKAKQLGILPTPIIFISFLLITFLYPKMRDDGAVLFLVATTVLPPLIAYNPGIPYLMSKLLAMFKIKISTEIIAMVTGLRTACLFPAVYVCAYVFYRVVNYLSKRIEKKTLINSLGLCSGLAVGIIAAHQFSPSYFAPLEKFLSGIAWPFYPPWAIFILAIVNLLLLASEFIFCFPSRLSGRYLHANGTLDEGSNDKRMVFDPLGPIAMFCLIALVTTLPAEIEFFSDHLRVQTLERLAQGHAGYKFLNDNIPQGAVILSDPINGIYLPGYTGHRPVDVNKNNSLSPLSPDLSSQRRYDLLKEYKVEYLYLDWNMLNLRIKKELDKFPERYQIIYQDKRVSVYKLTG